ncbi:HTH-like domain-containing protein [Epibacterium ulvae]|uniref:HTH-like domain-containing protein n=1 Tax=Epibacterium ulvae TaxID=1156985 RepID=A0A1G5Q518_9RHOB|nr:HTH-like domain-containing protein [Epibacterium ulvae]SCZ64792.1 HTH-like domain-containing protein [Epibacterium ulvae]SCZ71739.1 HTH-like domain-containing protein [Epibacterium ulvae]SCZ73015.1 HTH-like domain-containing protein [Epibacterium ulvae]
MFVASSGYRSGEPVVFWDSTGPHNVVPVGRADEGRLVADMIELARQYGRYGYRRMPALLRDAGWLVNDKRVERLWRREGLKVPMKQPKKGRLWLNDGSCVRLRPEYRNHVWSCDPRHCRSSQRRYQWLDASSNR